MDSIPTLPEALILASSLRAPLPTTQQQVWQVSKVPENRHSTLAELLAEQSGIYLKSYGPGASATTSIRGGSASQTRVLWNGLPLEHPMLGQMDFSLLPVAFADEVRVQYGGQSAGWGNGAIGGVIRFNNVPDWSAPSQESVQLEAGSFGSWKAQTQLVYGTNKWQGHTRLLYHQAENDFPYPVRPDQPEKILQHAFTRQMAGYQEGHFRLNDHSRLSVYGWWQQADREIPPTTQQSRSEAEQDDQVLRTAFHWTSWGTRTVWNIRAGVYHENLDFTDPGAGVESLSHFWTVVSETSWQWQRNARQNWEIGISETWHKAYAEAYTSPRMQWRLSPFIGFQHRLATLEIQGLVREEIVDGRHQVVTPSLSLSWHPGEILKFSGRSSRNYRLPTLNDLYWQPGGNTDLLPESGWSHELSIAVHPDHPHAQWQGSITAYSRQIRQWILWSALSGQAIWSPQNITEVWSRGMEVRISGKQPAGKTVLTLDAGYDLVWSTNEIAQSKPLLPAGSQLVYIPRNQVYGGLSWQWKNAHLKYWHHYTGSVSSLNAGNLPGYSLGNLAFTYRYHLSRINGTCYLKVANLWNVRYHVVEYRPMPGRNYALGMQFDLINQKNSKS